VIARRRPHVLIAGGGIGGLTAALALHAKGIEVTVFESVAEIKPLGVGINVLPHSVRILWNLGLQEALERTAILTGELRYHSKDGRTIWAEPRGLDAGYAWPQYSIHRGILQRVLLEAVRQRLGPERVVTQHHFAGMAQDASGVTVHFVDKKTGGARPSVRGDALIGADGIMSQVRRLFYPDEAPPRFHGLMLWRGVTEAAPFLTGRSMVMIGHDTLKFVAYPIDAQAARDGRSLINWIAERNVGPDYVHEREDWNRHGNPQDFLEHLKSWRFDWLSVPDVIERASAVFEFPMVDRDPIERWSFDRVTLLGDAAHAMRPNGSNGASQAILDAEALADALDGQGDVPDALMAYQAARLPPTAKLTLDNRRTGPERVLQMVEEQCTGQCGADHTCVPRDELAEVAQRYKKLAGFDKDRLNALRAVETRVP
jgi:2-polyprenyl-6-methoxyphenol hydroxylase-like FAD-dependent oxidoreductase